MPQKILVIEAYTDANIGSGALIENSVRLLKEEYPDSVIRVAAHDPEGASNVTDAECVPDFFDYPFKKPRWRQVVWLTGTLWWMTWAWLFPLSAHRIRRTLEPMQWADLVVSIGAERINDKFIRNVVFSLYTLALSRRMGKRVVMFPATIGPFLHGWTRSLAARVLAKMDLIFVRDERSYRETLALPGVDSSRVINTADVAVFQAWKDKARELLPATVTDQPLVGISVMRWTYKANKHETEFSNYASYVREIAQLADALIENYQVHVVFFPTNFPVHGCREDDVEVAREVCQKMQNSRHASIVEQLPTPCQFKGMLSCSEINITTRMHACILSTGACVPTISINYLFKLKDYMDSLGLSDFSIDIEDFNAESVLGMFSRMWNERPQWRERLKSKIAEKQKNLKQSLKVMHADA